MKQFIAHMSHVEGQDAFFPAAPRPGSNVLLTRNEVSAASLKVYDETSSTPTVAVHSVTLDVGANPPGATFNECMFLTPQYDDWYDFAGGYTFMYRLQNADYHLDGGKTYRVEVTLTAGHPTATYPQWSAYGNLILVWKVRVQPTTGA
jgi:hypothetical protein